MALWSLSKLRLDRHIDENEHSVFFMRRYAQVAVQSHAEVLTVERIN